MRAEHRPSAEWVLVPQHFGSLVYQRSRSRYFPFDHESTALLSALRTQPLVLSRQMSVPDRRGALLAFYRAFYRLGMFTLDGGFDADLLELVPAPDHLAGPLALHLELGEQCNLRCAHCFAARDLPGAQPGAQELSLSRALGPHSRGGPSPRALSLDEIDRLCAELAAVGCFRLGLTGGEPLLRPDLFDVLDCALAHGLSPCVTTNGLLVDERVARELGRRPLTWLNVSLDGATAESNDAIRGRGGFAAVMRAVGLLREHCEFSLAFTVTAQSADEVEACAALARRVGATTAVFRPLYPVGRAASRPDLTPSLEAYTVALERLEGRAGEPHELHVVEPFSPLGRRDRRARIHPGPGCGAANVVASVSARGEASPCSFLGPAFCAGNIRERPFAEIWNRGASFAALRRTPTRRDGPCFGGGCRARALAHCGDADGPDPWEAEYRALVAARQDARENEHDAGSAPR